MSQLKENRKTDKKSIVLMVISYPDTRLKKEMDSLIKKGYEVKVIIGKGDGRLQLIKILM